MEQSKYDVIEFPVPISGMNQFVSPDVLNEKFAYVLENIIPSPLGEGNVRFGTTEVISTDNIDDEIISNFPYQKENGEYQQIIYIDRFYLDISASETVRINNKAFRLNTEKLDKYSEKTRIKIVYQLNGVTFTLRSVIDEIIASELFVIITLLDNFFPNGDIIINEIWYSTGCIYCHEISNNTISNLLIDELSVACIPRCEYFKGYLLIFNGVDSMMSWDGENLRIVYDYVKENYIRQITRTSEHVLSIVKKDGFDDDKYSPGNIIKLFINNEQNLFVVDSSGEAEGLFNITTTDTIPEFSHDDSVELFYKEYLPAFSYVYASHDRLWALGPGAASINKRPDGQNMIVYYTKVPNTINRWFDEEEKTIPIIDMSLKYNKDDNLEAIAQVSGSLAFIGREHTQIWTGNTPGIDGNFQWSSNISTGTINGNLVCEMPNDICFVSQSGAKMVSSLNIAKQFALTSDNAVDNLMNNYISKIMSNDYYYRKCRTFNYNLGPMIGFKIGENKVLGALYDTKIYSWFLLSGDFMRANSFGQVGNALYLSIKNKIFKYSDGKDGKRTSHGDMGGDSFIPITWVPGLIRMKGRAGRLFANKRYQIVLNYSSSFVIEDGNLIQLTVDGDSPENIRVSDTLNFHEVGDSLETIPLSETGESTDFGLRFKKDYVIYNKRLKFKASEFWITISGYVKNSQLKFKRIKLFGIGERHV